MEEPQKGKNEDSLPDSAGVYMIWRSDELLYVGQSKSIKQRCSQFVITNDPDIKITYDTIENRKERLRRERELIEKHEPRLNKDNNASRNKYNSRVIKERT